MPRRQYESYKKEINELRQRIIQNPRMSKDEQVDAIAKLLTWQAIEKASLQDVSTDRKVKAFWQSNYEKIKAISTEFYDTLGKDKIKSALRKGDNDRTLNTEFRRFIGRRDRFPSGLHDSFNVFADYRVEQLIIKIKNGKYKSLDEKRHVMAEILAVRENVNAGRSRTFYKNNNLLNLITEDVSQKADVIDQELKKVPIDILEEQYRRIQEKHTYGGAMQEVFEPYRKPAVARELSQAIEFIRYSDDGVTPQLGAKVIWLLKNQNMTDEEFSEAKASGNMIDEVEQLQHSIAYNRWIDSMSRKEFRNTVLDIDPMNPESGRKLLASYDHAVEMEERRDPWASNLYDRLNNDGEAMGKFRAAIGQLAGKEFAEKLKLVPCAHNFIEQVNEINEALSDMENKYNFIKQAELLRDSFFYFNDFYIRHDSKILDEFPGLKDIYGEMSIPKERNADYFSHTQMGAVDHLNIALGTTEYVLGFLYKLAFYEQVRGVDDWSKVVIDEEKLDKRRGEFQDELVELEVKLEDHISVEKMYSLIMSNDSEKEMLDLYQKIVDEHRAKKEKKNAQTVEDYIEEITGFPKLKEMKKSGSADEDDVRAVQTDVLLTRKVWKEYTEHPENFKTVEDVKKCWEKYRGAYNYVNINTFNKQGDGPENYRLLLMDETGQKLEEEFKKAIPSSFSEFRYMKDIDASLQPTARERIEGLQAGLRNRKDWNSPNFEYDFFLMSDIMAQIIAAREVLQVRPGIPGGDDRMNARMNDQIYDKTEEIYRNISDLSKDEIKKLNRLAIEGHGGELQESYRKLMMKKASEKDVLPEQTPESQRPSARQRIRSMQNKLKSAETRQEKLHCIAEIIAARQYTGAVRGDIFGGDDRLNNKLDPKKLSVLSKDVEDYLSFMPDDVINRLIRKAGRGHGGAMTEEYMAQNTYKNQAEWMQAAFAGEKKPDIAKALYISLKVAVGKNTDMTINVKDIRNKSEALHKNPAFERFSSDPEIPDLFINGNVRALKMKWGEAVNQVEKVMKNQNGQNQVQNHVQNQVNNQVQNRVSTGPGH